MESLVSCRLWMDDREIQYAIAIAFHNYTYSVWKKRNAHTAQLYTKRIWVDRVSPHKTRNEQKKNQTRSARTSRARKTKATAVSERGSGGGRERE